MVRQTPKERKRMSESELSLRYGMNPHQAPARVFVPEGTLPIEVLGGSPGFINLLDALNSWQLVRELRLVLGQPAAASFKHVSPAGAAIASPLDDVLRCSYFVGDAELSPLATAYARARGADRMSAFGDFAALSDVVDVPTARLLRQEVSDGVIAPGFEPEALDLLRRKKDGKYLIIRVDPDYVPPALEQRQLFGVTFEQKRNDALPTPAAFQNVVTARKRLPDAAVRDMMVAFVVLKYTQSNSVCLTRDGQIIGNGAGQQSRVHCTRLAAHKADLWWLRQHPAVLGMRFKKGLGRPERDNAIDQYLRDDIILAEDRLWCELFVEVPRRLSIEEKHSWLSQLRGVTLGSDAFIPFPDTINRAEQSGVEYVMQPGGSMRDEAVIQACDEYGMVMVDTGVRLFHH
ncbi:MAG: phosphoribosylaminoimidazolecarboxamide formyltransferase [Anaerolineae bacterium]